MDLLQQQFANSSIAPQIWKLDRWTKGNSKLGSSHFDLLPDEIMIKIIKMALTNTHEIQRGKGHFLISVISKVSKRFRRLVPDKSVGSHWKGQVRIHGDESWIKDIIHHIISKEAEIEVLQIYGLRDEKSVQPTLTSVDIMQLAAKCQQLGVLSVHHVRMQSWPPLIAPWMLLRELSISAVDKTCFKNVNLHHIAPNLQTLKIEGQGEYASTLLPDMSGCDALSSITLHDGAFIFPDKIPFPYRLKELNGTESSLYCTKASFDLEVIYDHKHLNQLFQNYLENCTIQLKIIGMLYSPLMKISDAE